MRERRTIGRIEDVHVARAMVGDEARPALGDPPLGVDLHEPELPQADVDADLAIGPQEAVVGDHEHRGVALERPGRQRGQDAAHAVVDVLESPVRLRRAGAVQMLEAVGAEEMHEEQVGRMPVQHVGRDVGHHVVTEEALGELGPLAQSIDRQAERSELAPHSRMRGALEDALILEERQVEVEAGSPAGAGPVDRGGAPAGGMSDVVHGRRPQQPIRVVDGIAGEVLRAS